MARGDQVHKGLLDAGWTWDRCEEYRKGPVVLRPRVSSFPEQRHVPWDAVVVNEKGTEIYHLGTAEYRELMIFTKEDRR